MATSFFTQPKISTSVSLGTGSLEAGASESGSVTIANAGTGGTSGATVFGVLLPPGSTATVPAVPSSLDIEAKPGGTYTQDGAALYNPADGNSAGQCQAVVAPAAVVCVVNALPAGTTADDDFTYALPPSAGGTQLFTSGVLSVPQGGDATMLDDAAALVASNGYSILGDPQTVQAQLAGIGPNAGAAQRLLATSDGPNGSQVPPHVTLDASGTTGSGSQLSYAWNQESGPAVTWDPATAGTVPGPQYQGLPTFPAATSWPNGQSGPQDYGEKVGFTAPAAGVITSPTVLQFELTVTDGSVVKTAQTTVTLNPVAPPPPDPPPLCVSNFTKNSGCLTSASPTPTAGDRMHISTTTPYQEDTGRQSHYLHVLGDPARRTGGQLFQGFLVRRQLHLAAGVSQMVLGEAATNGQDNAQGVKEVVNESTTVGPDPPSARVIGHHAAPGRTGIDRHLDRAGRAVERDDRYLHLHLVAAERPHGHKHPFGRRTVSFTAPPTVIGQSTDLRRDRPQRSGTQAPTASTTVTVPLGHDTAPTVSIAHAAALSVRAPATCRFTASGSGDGTLTYTWAVVSGGGSVAPASGASTTYTPGPAGVAVVRVKVTDPSGASSYCDRQCCRGSDRGHPDGSR